MRMTGAQAIIKALELEGVGTVFGYPGAAISPFYDALVDSNVRHILTRHEQGAAHAANGYARVTGRVGVCVSTSGPGATNLITGIANAYMDSIPIVAITGQVDRELIGTDAFQEADITGATAPFCKHNYLVKNADNLPRIIKEAFHIAGTGRKGPVVIDVPVDVQNSILEFNYPDTISIKGYKPTYKGHPVQIKRALTAIEKASAPIICAGGGVIASDASMELQKLAEAYNIPVVTTMMGIGSIPYEHPLHFGMVGSHGSNTANYALHNADVVIILGARAGNRAIGSSAVLSEKATIIHIDIDPAEIGKNIDASIPLVGDVKLILKELLDIAGSSDDREWVDNVAAHKNQLKQRKRNNSDSIDPKNMLSILSDFLPTNAVIATEVGQNQIWTANNYRFSTPKTFITSGGLGTMGYGLPAAVGAKLGKPDVPVVVVSGDGSFQMSMQELGTMKQYNIGVKIILFNNQRLGLVRELQDLKHGSRYSQIFLDNNPDFVMLAKAYGFKGERISKASEVEGAMKRLTEDNEPYLLECVIDPFESSL